MVPDLGASHCSSVSPLEANLNLAGSRPIQNQPTYFFSSSRRTALHYSTFLRKFSRFFLSVVYVLHYQALPIFHILSSCSQPAIYHTSQKLLQYMG